MATARYPRRTAPHDDRDARVAAVVPRHLPALLRVARRLSLCADDAQDAVQRALEIYVRRLDTVEAVTEVAWLKVVVRHEALAIRRARQDSVAGEEVDFEAHAAVERGVEDRVAGSERVTRSAEALRALKPDEATALLLKAQGHSYAEISERQGWTYTKVNRCVTEGRKRFLEVYAELESGEGCARLAPVLARLAAGTAESKELVALRVHVRHCSACRARVRELHGARRPRALAWLPLPLLAAPLRWLQRLGGSDVVAGAQLAGASGGGRGMGVAALVGLCLSGAGAGTYCAMTGALPGSPAAIVREAEPTPRRDARRAPRERRSASPSAIAAASTPVAAEPAAPRDRLAATRATPDPAAPRPRVRAARPAPAETPAPADELGFEAGEGGTGAPQAATSGAPAARRAPPATTRARRRSPPAGASSGSSDARRASPAARRSPNVPATGS